MEKDEKKKSSSHSSSKKNSKKVTDKKMKKDTAKKTVKKDEKVNLAKEDEKITSSNLEEYDEDLKGMEEEEEIQEKPKKVKTTNYEIVSALITNTKDKIGLSMLEDIGELKNTDIPIMDLASTGSTIAKKKYLNAFVFADIKKVYFDDTKKKETKTIEQEKQEKMEFIEDFKI